ncbi:probable disease resistance protein At1g58390 [Cornus florida]|uniref:probable disease resistance protein At1g58390 n=1 Tax=Cornus florida TaxID=4283 RepID=UPI0028A2A3B3|nr:probable disease resistance protein At1g58390 [Cornus florida]
MGYCLPWQLVIASLAGLGARINQQHKRYGFSSLEQGSISGTKDSTGHDPPAASLFIAEDDVVGIEFLRDELISKLLAEQPTRAVISLVGMGGLGKTTLAKKVYDNARVTRHFDYCAWIFVSQSYKTEELLRTIIKQFYDSRKELVPDGIDSMEKVKLIEKLKEYLEPKRYVIVFDDVWEIEVWSIIKHALPKNNKCSRLICELIVSKSEELSFCQAVEDDSSFDGQSRRLSFHNPVYDGLETIGKLRIRSCFILKVDKELPKPFLGMLFAKFKQLKVLDLEGAPFDNLTEEVGKLFHFKSSSLRDTIVKILPKSIGKLYNLETLDLKYSLVDELPCEISKLHKLRHLLAYDSNYNVDSIIDIRRGVKVQEGIGHLKELQKLRYVEASHEGFEKVGYLEKMGGLS